MKLRKLIAGIIGAAMMVPTVAMPVLAANSEIAINATNFPDANFRRYVSDEIDTDGNGKLSKGEREVSEIDVSEKDISSLAGIEFFNEVSFLNFTDNKLTNIDVSHNTALVYLICSSNQLTSIDVSNNSSLRQLNCDSNNLTTLDISSNANLSYLECSDNQLSNIDVSNNDLLEFLICSNNRLTSIDVSDNANLDYLECSDNQLTSLDVTENLELVELYIAGNQLTDVDVSNNTKLSRLDCSRNQLTDVDVSHNTKLSRLDCSRNQLTNIDLSNNELESLYCYGNPLVNLDLSNQTWLNWIEIDSGVLDFNNLDNERFISAYNLGVVDNLDLWRTYLRNDAIETVYTYLCQVWHDDVCDVTDFNYGDSDYLAVIIVNVPEQPVPSEPETSGVSSFAERLYTCALDRESEQAGKDYWADALRHGTTGADAAYGFLFSEEVANANLDDETFINRLYATLMDREPAEAEVEYWGSEIAAGRMTRQDVFAGFINSEEWANVCVTYGILSGGTGIPSITVEPSQAILDFATRLYTTCLNREADQAGLEWWAGELANLRTTGSAAAQSYFFSEEFINANVDDREFVNRLYLTFMNRDAADGEFDYWLGEMGNGMTRETVFSGFAGSEEFGNICAEYGIIR